MVHEDVNAIYGVFEDIAAELDVFGGVKFVGHVHFLSFIVSPDEFNLTLEFFQDGDAGRADQVAGEKDDLAIHFVGYSNGFFQIIPLVMAVA